MDGKELLYALRQLLTEDANSAFLDDKTTYQYLWEAATAFVDKTNCLRSTQSITTVADQSTYTLSADFLKLYLKNTSNEKYIKYNDGSDNHFPTERDYEDIIYEDNTTSVSLPNRFAITSGSASSQVTGTATSNGTATGGKSTLTDSTAGFSGVAAGDTVHNTTDGSDGIIVTATSSTALGTALFGGTNNDWTSGDAYIIQPQGRLSLVLDPPPSTAGHTITVYYVQRPAPVFTSYDSYAFQSHHLNGILKYAAWLYKYRDQEPDFGNSWFQHWDRMVRDSSASVNQAFNRTQFRVNLKRRR